jgi:hypothetical protein
MKTYHPIDLYFYAFDKTRYAVTLRAHDGANATGELVLPLTTQNTPGWRRAFPPMI